MIKDPAFLFYPGDYLRDTQCLSEKSQVAYDRIMCEHMRNICIRQEQLNFFTKRLNDLEKEELLMVLDQNEQGFYIPWVVESIEKRRKYSESRRKNREGKSKKDMNNISKSYVEHMENENENINSKEKGGVGEKEKQFEQWWLIYNKKTGKAKCFSKWMKLKKADIEKIFEVTRHYVSITPDVKYRKNPLTWLNGKHWEDEIIVAETTPVIRLQEGTVGKSQVYYPK